MELLVLYSIVLLWQASIIMSWWSFACTCVIVAFMCKSYISFHLDVVKMKSDVVAKAAAEAEPRLSAVSPRLLASDEAVES